MKSGIESTNDSNFVFKFISAIEQHLIQYNPTAPVKDKENVIVVFRFNPNPCGGVFHPPPLGFIFRVLNDISDAPQPP